MVGVHHGGRRVARGAAALTVSSPTAQASRRGILVCTSVMYRGVSVSGIHFVISIGGFFTSTAEMFQAMGRAAREGGEVFVDKGAILRSLLVTA